MGDMRVYQADQCVVFHNTNKAWGELSNMAASPIMIRGLPFRTNEALYQACRFPHRTDIQLMIVDSRSPMTAKRIAHQYAAESRPDWLAVRFDVMRWCLRQKYLQCPPFVEILRSTADKPIVELSYKDQTWGAMPKQNGTIVGYNILGRLLMELRLMDRSGLSKYDKHWCPDIGLKINGMTIH